VHYLADKDVTLVSSTDPFMWDLVTSLAAERHMDIKLIVKSKHDREGSTVFDSLLEEYALDPKRTAPVFLGETPGPSPKKLWVSRDRFAVHAADIIYPVSINPDGKLERLMAEPGIEHKINNNFRIPWRREQEIQRIPAYDFSGGAVNPFPEGKWLVHWTRTSQGKWPGENARKYIRDLCKIPDIYVRNAKETVLHIVSERVIRCSSWNIPDGACAVSFTSLSAEEAVQLMRWRKRYVRYSFEPYGIAVKQDVLSALGAHEIHYEKPCPEYSGERLYVQSPGEKGEWTKECEWRLRGCLKLNEIDPSDYFVIVYNESEMVELNRRMTVDGVYIHALKR
jgi:hypothetical protein